MGKRYRYFVEHKNAVPVSLREQSESLLASEWSGEYPPEPVIEVSSRYCAINNPMAWVRNLIPFIILILGFVAYSHMRHIIGDWQNEEKHAIENIVGSKTAYGEDYFDKTKNPIALEIFNMIDQDGKMSFKRYVRYVYFETPYGHRMLIADILKALLYVPFIPWLLYVLIRFPRYAPLYFDRERRIVWTWRKGQVWGRDYDDIGVPDSVRSLFFAVRVLKKNGRIRRRLFTVDLPGTPYYIKPESREALLGFIVRYMEYGKDRVWPGPDYKTRPGFFLFEDKKPADAEHQLETLLKLGREDEGKPPSSLLDAW